MEKVAFYTLGCKVNQYETEAITGIFGKEGYQVVDFDDRADVYVINTCTVTNLSDRKSRQMIHRARKNNENAVIVVTGCYSQTSPDEVAKIPGVNLIIGTKDRAMIPEYVRQIQAGQRQINMVDSIMKTRLFEELKVDSFKERTRAFLKIQEGCSQFCSYCIIPYARGPIRSRNADEVISEVMKLADGGFKEVVLTGIHLASYGKDIGNTSLLDIITRVHEIEGVERIRLGSIEPTTITKEFVDAVSKMPKLCPHYHISLQSGSDEVLKRMNRRYTAGEYREVVRLLRENIRDVAITTDVMTGFPGETDELFEETYRFVDSISFAKTHIFKYSPRKGTPAAGFADQVEPQVKEERSRRLIELDHAKVLEFNSGFSGRIMPVLYEHAIDARGGIFEGTTPNYIRVFSSCSGDMKGVIADTRLIAAEEDHMEGELL